MKDEEIIVALDRCGYLKDCADCPLSDMDSVDKCMHTLLINALDLINRLQAENKELEAMLRQQAEMVDILKIACEEKNKEIDRQKYILDSYALQYGTVVDKERLFREVEEKAAREFADKIKATFPDRNDPRCTDDDIFTLNSIDNLLNEMYGRENGKERKR